jgi:hypothetical protein
VGIGVVAFPDFATTHGFLQNLPNQAIGFDILLMEND